MILMYNSPSCASCGKAKRFFNSNEIHFSERNILSHNFSHKDIVDILKLTNGAQDIISERSKYVKQNPIDFTAITINQLIDLIKKEPLILKRPLIIDKDRKRLQIGYNSDDIELFLR